jgi:hypothetical protein
MMLAHGSVGLIYAMLTGFWLVNLALLLPGLLVRRAHLAILILTGLVTVFDAWFVWSTVRDILRSSTSDLWFGVTLVALFAILFFAGSFGLFRWTRLPKS